MGRINYHLSEAGLLTLREKGKQQGIRSRNEKPDVLEVSLDSFNFSIQPVNAFLEKTKLDWNKVQYVLKRNGEYIIAGYFPQSIKPTYRNFWCAYISTNTNVNHYITIMKRKIAELQARKLFDELYRQEKKLLNQSIRFPVTAKEALDDFYEKNVLFFIYRKKPKKEKLKLFLKDCLR
jgi:hypothetical protein